MLAERTLAFASQAPALQTRRALCASLMTLIEDIGATRFACLYLRREAGGLTIARSISNLPQPWQQLYLEKGFEETDPVLQTVMRSNAYGFWDELTHGVVLGRASREVMHRAYEFDMREGFTKRVALDSGGAAVMMVAGLELVRNDRTRASLRMAFDVFANEGARMLKLADDDAQLDPAGVQSDLSRTQLKVLMMRAEGLSNKQVATALGRREKTIECHVTEILRRLEARNMIDAIRIAGQQKLII
jgi:DNA-binding NarL/FixJ family response regulator